MPSFFIYNGSGAYSHSVDDLSVFCESLSKDNTVYKWSDGQQFTGVNKSDHPTLVIPGGSTVTIGIGINKNRSQSIAHLVQNQSWNYLGSCAGAYLASTNAQFFQCTYEKTDDDKHELPNYFSSTEIFEVNLNLLSSLAYGPFYPDASYYNRKGTFKENKPYSVDLNIGAQSIRQLYIAGCGFAETNEKTETVVVSYSGRFRFFYPKGRSTQQRKLAAIVIKEKRGRSGSVFASGVHFEAMVPESKVLNHVSQDCSNSSPILDSLTQEDFTTLSSDREGNLNFTQELVRRTLALP